MSEYQDLINQLAKALPEREDLLEQVNQLVEKYEQQATPRFVIPVDALGLFQSHHAGMCSFSEQNNMKVSDQKNTSLKGQNKRLKKILRFIVNEL